VFVLDETIWVWVWLSSSSYIDLIKSQTPLLFQTHVLMFIGFKMSPTKTHIKFILAEWRIFCPYPIHGSIKMLAAERVTLSPRNVLINNTLLHNWKHCFLLPNIERERERQSCLYMPSAKSLVLKLKYVAQTILVANMIILL